jgi:hypothetical protein
MPTSSYYYFRLRRKYSPSLDLDSCERGKQTFWRMLRLETPALYVQSGYRRPQRSGDRWDRSRLTTSCACAPLSDKYVSAGTLFRVHVRYACELYVTAPMTSSVLIRGTTWVISTDTPWCVWQLSSKKDRRWWNGINQIISHNNQWKCLCSTTTPSCICVNRLPCVLQYIILNILSLFWTRSSGKN